MSAAVCPCRRTLSCSGRHVFGQQQTVVSNTLPPSTRIATPSYMRVFSRLSTADIGVSVLEKVDTSSLDLDLDPDQHPMIRRARSLFDPTIHYYYTKKTAPRRGIRRDVDEGVSPAHHHTGSQITRPINRATRRATTRHLTQCRPGRYGSNGAGSRAWTTAKAIFYAVDAIVVGLYALTGVADAPVNFSIKAKDGVLSLSSSLAAFTAGECGATVYVDILSRSFSVSLEMNTYGRRVMVNMGSRLYH
ncbi:hypothetical protein QQS21_008264 [Conoideocrella luteorostrata]|uniref:Uncharacterized protein n=1 Tax=Conoideocrella luteorostrata TaxID=1105319 RepID=A0AAJ0FYU6_9HYPO|nr:hypothetical protein QQS21_008264 [Conoideocrella luteorostrata]